MTDESEYEYEIAMSFLAGDEPLAQRLADLLQEHLPTFIYSKKQEALAGRDGEATFSEIFAKKSRVVAILYRPEWGTTTWTRIEQDAIRNRAYDHGYDFTVWIPLHEPPSIPDYIPKNRLYANIARFGEKGAAAVIEQLATERGAQITIETSAQRAARARRALEFAERRRTFLGLGEGAKQARDTGLKIIDGIKEWAKTDGATLSHEVREYPGSCAIVYRGGAPRPIVMTAAWRQMYSNSHENAGLEVRVCFGFPHLPGTIIIDEPDEVASTKLTADLSPAGEIVWREHGGGDEPVSSADLLRKITDLFTDKIVELSNP